MRVLLLGFGFLLFVAKIMGSVERVETLFEVKEFQEGHELICLSLSVYRIDDERVTHAPVVFLKKNSLSSVRLRYSESESQFYVLMHRTSFPLEGGGMYVVGNGNPRPKKFGKMEREHFEYMAEHGVLHYQVNRDLAFDDDFLDFFGIVVDTYEPDD